MLLTESQYHALKAITNSRNGIFYQEHRFYSQTVAALLSRRLIDIYMDKKHEGLMFPTGFARPVLKLNHELHAYGVTFKQHQKTLRGIK